MKELFITSKNIDLWEKLIQNFTIEIVPNNVNEYSVFTQNNNATIYYDSSNICEASFTHELLHINLKYHEFYITGAMKMNMKTDYLLDRLLPVELIDHIGNVIDHLKMYKDYLKMGYEPSRFLHDYINRKVDKCRMNEIANTYKKDNKINCNAVHLFIGNLSAIIGDVNENNNYHIEEIQFQNIDQELFDAVSKLFVDIINHEYETADFMYNYRDIANSFHDRLVTWKNNNQFI